MADETKIKDDSKPVTEPAKQARATKAEAQPEKTAAASQLRAFEDEHFGEDCVRILGQIERGSGSPFSQMTDEEKAHYAALERLVEVERKGDEANEAMSVAKSNYEAALSDVETSAKAVTEAKAKSDEHAAAAKARADARAARQPASV